MKNIQSLSSNERHPVSQSVCLFVRTFVALLIVFFVLPVHPLAQDTYPVPVSESVEKTGPGTMVFLSYPKYYRDAEEKLALVETDLVESTDPEWDYEVNKGIWQLKVKTDGTFQAQHEGDVFTYRFQSLGIGQGSEFRSVDLGEPDFSNFQIIGDTIRWSEVLPDIDLTVRYIHDILKVDVIVKREFMNDLRPEVNSGGLSGEDYLTARFDIPSVFINSQTKQGGEDRDIYAEPIEFTNAPLTFERDGKVLHKLRPVESYVLDEDGEPMYWDESNEPINIRSSQRWQLQRSGGGFAEMSANLGDLSNAPEGDVVIDPSTTFDSSSRDTLIQLSGSYGNSSIVNWHGGAQVEYLLFGFDVADELPNGIQVDSALLNIDIYQNQNPDDAGAIAYKMNTSWDELTADWDTPWASGPSSGTDFDTSITSGTVVIDYDYEGWITFEVKDILNAHLENSEDDINNKGIILARDNSYEDDSLRIYMRESASRPYLEVDYTVVHEMRFYKRPLVDADNSLIDSWIDAANDSWGPFGSLDVAMSWNGNITEDNAFPRNIINSTHMDQTFNVLNNYSGEHRVLVVNNIPYGGIQAESDGIGSRPNIIIEIGVNNPKVLAHELGHNVGCSHCCADDSWLMYFMSGPNSGYRKLTSDQRNKFRSKQYCF